MACKHEKYAKKMRNQRGGKLFHSMEFYIAQLNDINRFKV